MDCRRLFGRESYKSLGREIGDTIYVKSESDYGPEQLAIMTALGEIQGR